MKVGGGEGNVRARTLHILRHWNILWSDYNVELSLSIHIFIHFSSLSLSFRLTFNYREGRKSWCISFFLAVLVVILMQYNMLGIFIVHTYTIELEHKNLNAESNSSTYRCLTIFFLLLLLIAWIAPCTSMAKCLDNQLFRFMFCLSFRLVSLSLCRWKNTE
jgi:hypothetical protein